jgi:hypothetical protein
MNDYPPEYDYDYGIEVKVDGVWYCWTEDDSVYKHVPNSTEREDGYVLIGTLETPDLPEFDPKGYLYKFVKCLNHENQTTQPHRA